MHVGPPLVADQQSLEAMQPGEAALHDPAIAPQSGAVRGSTAGDLWPDAALAQLASIAVVVVATVGVEASGASPGPAHLAAHRRHGIEQGQQLGDVVAIAAGQGAGERQSFGLDEEVVLGARTAPIDRARARLGAPFLAWI